MEKNIYRQSNIDLFKIILILMVLMLHFNTIAFKSELPSIKDSTFLLLRFIESFSIVAVNCFVIITGFFSVNSKSIKFSKIIFLFTLNIIFNIFCYLFSFLFGDAFNFKSLALAILRQTYFINFYIVLLLVSPLLNRFFCLKVKVQTIYLVSFLILFSLVPSIARLVGFVFDAEILPGFSYIIFPGYERGFSIVNFILLYLIGGFIAHIKSRVNFLNKKWVTVIIYIFSLLFVFAISIFYDFIWDYNNIFVVVESIAFFVLFTNIKLKHSYFLQEISKCSFGIYAIHTTNLFYAHIFPIFKIDYYTSNGVLDTLAVLFIFIFSIFIVTSVIDLIFRNILMIIFKKMNVSKIDLNINFNSCNEG